MSTIPNTGQTQTGAVAHNDLSDSSMATGTEGSAHGQSVDGLDNRGGIDQGKPDLQGKPAPEKGAVASVSNLPVTFEQPDKSPPVATPAPVLELNQGGGKGKPAAKGKAKGTGKASNPTGKSAGNGKAETNTSAKPVPPSFDELLATMMAACAADREAGHRYWRRAKTAPKTSPMVSPQLKRPGQRYLH